VHSFHADFVAEFLQAIKCDFGSKTPVSCFWAPFRGLRGNVRCSSHLKTRSGLPISVNWTLFARCYRWGATSEYRLKIGVFAPTGSVWPKISGKRGRPLPTVLLLIKIWAYAYVSFVLSQVKHLTDRRTDTILVASSCLHSMQRGN